MGEAHAPAHDPASSVVSAMAYELVDFTNYLVQSVCPHTYVNSQFGSGVRLSPAFFFLSAPVSIA